MLFKVTAVKGRGDVHTLFILIMLSDLEKTFMESWMSELSSNFAFLGVKLKLEKPLGNCLLLWDVSSCAGL